MANVKIQKIYAFFGHSRSFAYPKPCIGNDRRDEIYSPDQIYRTHIKSCLKNWS